MKLHDEDAGALFLAAGCFLLACSSGNDDKDCCGDAKFSVARSDIARVPVSAVAAEDLQSAVTANNAFALSLFGQVVAQPSGANVLLSPVSASLALTMAYAGANAATKSQMAQALGFSPESERSIFAGQNALSQALNFRAAAALSYVQTTAAQAQTPKPDAGDYQLSWSTRFGGSKRTLGRNRFWISWLRATAQA